MGQAYIYSLPDMMGVQRQIQKILERRHTIGGNFNELESQGQSTMTAIAIDNEVAQYFLQSADFSRLILFALLCNMRVKFDTQMRSRTRNYCALLFVTQLRWKV
jgi:hypothetical protein